MRAPLRSPGFAAIVAASGAVCLATLWPLEQGGLTAGPWCIACGDLGGLDFVLNIALFVPLGVALAAHGVRPGRALLFPVVLSLAVELLQWRVVPGRDASVGDLLANSLGGWIGFGATRWLLAVRRGGGSQRLVALTALAGWLGFLALAAWALRPAPMTERAWVQISPLRRGFLPFEGTVGLEMPEGTLLNGQTLDPAQSPSFTRGEHEMRLLLQRYRVTPPGRRELILRLANPRTVFMQVAQYDLDLSFRGYFNASRLRLPSPLFRLYGAFREGETRVVFEVNSRPGVVVLRSQGDHTGHLESRELVTVARAWELLSPLRVVPRSIDVAVRHLWLAVGFGVLAALFARAWPAGTAAPVLAGALVLALVVMPRAAGISPCTGAEGLSALGGAALGALASRRALRVRASSVAGAAPEWHTGRRSNVADR